MSNILVTGYALDNEELTPGIRSVGCALRSRKGRAVCAIAIEEPRPKFGPNRKTHLLRALLSARDKIMESVK